MAHHKAPLAGLKLPPIQMKKRCAVSGQEKALKN